MKWSLIKSIEAFFNNGFPATNDEQNRAEIVAVVFGLLATMSIGITGSVAALGDTLFPAVSLRTSLSTGFFFRKYPLAPPVPPSCSCSHRSDVCFMDNPEKLKEPGPTVEPS